MTVSQEGWRRAGGGLEEGWRRAGGGLLSKNGSSCSRNRSETFLKRLAQNIKNGQQHTISSVDLLRTAVVTVLGTAKAVKTQGKAAKTWGQVFAHRRLIGRRNTVARSGCAAAGSRSHLDPGYGNNRYPLLSSLAILSRFFSCLLTSAHCGGRAVGQLPGRGD